MKLTIYVPTEDTGIAQGSAIVGEPRPVDDYVLVDFEGDIYKHMHGWREKLVHAVGRYCKHYPTVARKLVKKEKLKEVGTVKLAEDCAIEAVALKDPARLAAWTGEDFDLFG